MELVELLKHVMPGVVEAGGGMGVRWSGLVEAGEVDAEEGAAGEDAGGGGGRGELRGLRFSFKDPASKENGPDNCGNRRFPTSSAFTLSDSREEEQGALDGGVLSTPGTPKDPGPPRGRIDPLVRRLGVTDGPLFILSLLSSFLTSVEHMLSGEEGEDLLLLVESLVDEPFFSGPSSGFVRTCRLCFMRRFWNQTFTCKM